MSGLRPSTQSKSSHSRVDWWWLGLGFLMFLGVWILTSYLYVSQLTEWWRAREWVEVPCQIESAEIKRGYKESPRAVASYRYRYKGRDYPGNRISLGDGSDDVHSGLFAHHRGGDRQFHCFVNPAKPSEAVIYRAVPPVVAGVAIMMVNGPVFFISMVALGFFAPVKKVALLRNRFPGQPWKWRTEWAESTIPEHGASVWPAFHAYSLWSGLVFLPLIAAMITDGSFGSPMSLLSLFPFAVQGLCCVFMWFFSLKRIRHRMAVGETRLELSPWPVNPGGLLQGHLLLGRPLPACGVMEFDLVCEKSIARKSSSRATTEKIWCHRESVAMDRVSRDIAGYRLPVRFTLPGDAPESSREKDAELEFKWQLEFAVPGTAIRSKFEIPVYHAAAGTAAAAMPREPVPLMMVAALADLGGLLASSSIQATFNPAGHPQSIICPPRRNIDRIWILVFLNLILMVPPLLIYEIARSWRIIFLVFTSTVGLFLIALCFIAGVAVSWCRVIWLALHQRTVSLTGTALEVQHRFGPLAWGHVFPKPQILTFSHNFERRIGATAYYRVRLESVTGKKVTLVDGIGGNFIAAALVERLEDWKKRSADL